MSVYARLALAHLPAFLIGLGLVELLWPRRGPRESGLKLCLGLGLGWGVSSSLYFAWSLAFTPYASAFRVLEALLGLGLAGAALWRGRFEWRAWLPPRLDARILAPGAALLVFLALAALLWQRADGQPNGNFDAYAIWNLRARFLFLSRSSWTAAFSPLLAWWTHADYPLLWPLTLLRGYFALGRLLTQAGVFQTVAFGLITGGLFVAALQELRGGWQAALGGLALLGLPWFVNFNAFQQSDVPLVFYYLAACALLVLALREERPRLGLWALAGLAAACAGWTKNDGLVFLIAAAGWAAVFAWRSRQGRPLLAFGLGMLPPLAALLAFKLLLAPSGDLIGGQTPMVLLGKIADPSRYGVIGLAILKMLPRLGGLPWLAVLAGALYFPLAGLSPRRGGAWVYAILGLTLLGYCAIYLITPHPLEWHLGYSLDRLLFHLLVPALFLALVQARSPEEHWARLFSK